MMYDRRHTREIKDYGGLAKMVPLFAVFFGIAIFSSVGLPGLNGFIGEYLTMMGAYYSPVLNTWSYAIWSATGVILAAVYLLWMYQRFVFGLPAGVQPHSAHGAEHPVEQDTHNHKTPDLTWRELVAVIPIVAFMIWIGLQPMNFMKTSERSMYQMSDDLLKMKTGSQTASLIMPAHHNTFPSEILYGEGKQDSLKDRVSLVSNTSHRKFPSALSKMGVLRSEMLRSE
jgi:NADH:ubiquinone oxidoreductase subunit 4 (subunit M)